MSRMREGFGKLEFDFHNYWNHRFVQCVVGPSTERSYAKVKLHCEKLCSSTTLS